MIAIIQTIIKSFLRNKTMYAFIAIGIIISLISSSIGELALNEKHKIMIDMVIGSTEIIGLITAIFFGSTLLNKAKQEKTIQLLFTHNMSKQKIYISYFLWFAAVISLLYIILATTGSLILLWYGIVVTSTMILAMIFLWLKLIIIAAIAFFLSVITSSYISIIVTLAIYIVGHSISFVRYLIQQQNNASNSGIINILYHLTPNFSLLSSNTFIHTQAYLSGFDIFATISISIVQIILITFLWSYIFARKEI